MTRDADEQLSGEARREAAGILPQPGEIFDGKYRIERAIGQGAMAIVLQATHLQLEDRVAIKLLLPQFAADPQLVERFMREGRAATRIRSEHVVRVFDVGVTGANPYLVMEYLDGSDLDQVLAHGGPLPVEVAIDYLLQACEAIAEAHVLGIVHRDLKPANLFLIRRADGSACVKVLDFGISKATMGVSPDTRTTEPSTVMGSPHYMSPEQMLSSKNVDVRADVWALGAILHELLVASPPFDGETIAALSAAVLRDPAPPLTTLRTDVPPGVEAVVLRCLEKEPARRFANVAELAAALAELGSPSARASAERIARVLDGGTGKISVPSSPAPRLAEAKTERVIPASILASASAASALPRARGRVFGYVIAGVTFVVVASGIGWMIGKDDGAIRAAEERAHADASAPSAMASEAASAASPVGTATNASAQANLTPNGSTAPGGHDHPREAPGAAQASGGDRSPTPAAHPPVHARGPRRGPRPPPRIQPLPDFPVPTADPEGEPSSRPIGAPPPAPAPGPAPQAPAPAAAQASAPTANPPLPSPSTTSSAHP